MKGVLIILDIPPIPGNTIFAVLWLLFKMLALKWFYLPIFVFFFFLPKGLSLRRGLGHNLKLAFWGGGQNGLRRLKLALKSAFKQTFRPDWAWRAGVVFLYIPWFYFFLSPSWSP